MIRRLGGVWMGSMAARYRATAARNLPLRQDWRSWNGAASHQTLPCVRWQGVASRRLYPINQPGNRLEEHILRTGLDQIGVSAQFHRILAVLFGSARGEHGDGQPFELRPA